MSRRQNLLTTPKSGNLLTVRSATHRSKSPAPPTGQDVVSARSGYRSPAPSPAPSPRGELLSAREISHRSKSPAPGQDAEFLPAVATAQLWRELMALRRRQDRKFGELRDQHDALRTCLFEAGVIEEGTFNDVLVRRRFDLSSRKRNFLSNVLKPVEVGLPLSRFVGPRSASALCCCSRETMKVMSEIRSALREVFASPGHDASSPREAFARRVYVCGGWDEETMPLNTVERFDPALGVWEPMPPMREKRSNAAAASIGRRLYVCGGSVGKALNTAERFDPVTKTWSRIPSMLAHRANAAAVSSCGRLFVMGGSDTTGLSHSSVERFDPAAGAWEVLPAMSVGRDGPAAAAICNNIYVCGGSDCGLSTSSVERLDTAALTWKAVPKMFSKRDGAAAASFNSILYICGGSDNDIGKPRLTGEMLDTAAVAPAWQAMPSMTAPRELHAFTKADGLIYVCGGNDERDQATNSAEVFDPVQNVWRPVKAMLQRRGGLAAAAITS